jgi:hypothetical protein
LRKVKNFTIENSFGKIIFDGETDILGLNLDNLVTIKSKCIEVYPEDKDKPPLGEKLNKPAIMHLYKVMNKKDQHHQRKEEVIMKMKKQTENMDVTLTKFIFISANLRAIIQKQESGFLEGSILLNMAVQMMRMKRRKNRKTK